MRKVLLVTVLLAGLAGCGPKAPGPRGSVESGPIAWMSSFDAAKTKADKEHKLLLVDFYATWCGPCKEMKETTWKSPKVIEKAAAFVPVEVDVDQNSSLANQYSISGIPAVVILRPDGTEVDRREGMREAPEIGKWLDEVASK
jgi:thioredoxin 1